MINVTKELGEYLLAYAVDLIAEKIIEVKEEKYPDIEGRIRDRCYEEIGELFDDAMAKFDMTDVYEGAVEALRNKIKDALFEQTGECCDYKRQNYIDYEIGKYEELIEKIRGIE